MLDQSSGAVFGRIIDPIAKLQIPGHEIDIHHSAWAPLYVTPRASRFFLRKPRANATQLFDERRVARRCIKARIADQLPSSLAEVQIARDLASFEVCRMLPRRSSTGDVGQKAAQPKGHRSALAFGPETQVAAIEQAFAGDRRQHTHYL